MTSEILQHLEAIIPIQSTTDNPRACKQVLDYCRDLFSDIDWIIIEEIEHEGVHSLVVKNFDGKRADVCLSGHVDVVPVQDPSQRTPRIEWDYLYGRGSWDMKDGVIVMTQVLHDVLQEQSSDKKLMLILTSDEEIGWARGAGYLASLWYGGDVVLVCDGGNRTTLVYAEKGIITLKLTAQGQAGHSSRPWLYDNAIERLYSAYSAIKQSLESDSLSRENHRWTSVQLTEISWWTASNVIPGEATWTLNLRYTEEYTYNEIITHIETSLTKIWSVEYEIIAHGDLMHTDADHPAIQRYFSIVQEHTNRQAILKKEHWASDGRHFAARWSVVMLHKPTCYDIHGRDERTTIPDFDLIYQCYKEFIIS